ncbi:MAG: helix-turn-helix domain-containing protein [Saprospiraceae bacterium]
MENPFEILSQKLDQVLTELSELKTKHQEPPAAPTPAPPALEPEKRFYKVKEAAFILSCSAGTIRGYIRTGKLKAIKNGRGINGTVRIENTEIERFIQSMKQKKVDL